MTSRGDMPSGRASQVFQWSGCLVSGGGRKSVVTDHQHAADFA